jgi:hypothetical protein
MRLIDHRDETLREREIDPRDVVRWIHGCHPSFIVTSAGAHFRNLLRIIIEPSSEELMNNLVSNDVAIGITRTSDHSMARFAAASRNKRTHTHIHVVVTA